MKRLLFASIAAVAALTAACGPLFCPAVQCDCAQPIFVTVTAPAGTTLAHLHVEGTPSSNCWVDEAEPNKGSCSVGTGPGSYAFDVLADGFKAEHLTTEIEPSKREVIDQCGCDCGYVSKHLEVTLTSAN